MTKQELLEFIKEAKALGLKSIEVDGVKVEFNDGNQKEPLAQDARDLDAKDLVAPPNPYDELTDEEILFWSSDYGHELAAKRKKEQEDNIKRKEDDSIRQEITTLREE